MTRRFNFGDLVELIGPRHKGFANEHMRDHGKLAVVIASYGDQYGPPDDCHSYTISILPDEGHCSWFLPSELRLIKPNFASFAGFKPYQSCLLRVNP